MPNPNPNPFTPANWYWSVGGAQDKVFSSAVGDYVPVADATYQAWCAAGNAPTDIDSEASLGQVLAQYVIRPSVASVLDSYTGAHADNIVAQVVFKVLFNHENRLRALEGKQPITAQQARNAIKAQM